MQSKYINWIKILVHQMVEIMRIALISLILLMCQLALIAQGGFVKFLDSGPTERNQVYDIHYDKNSDQVLIIYNHVDSMNFYSLGITSLDTNLVELWDIKYSGDYTNDYILNEFNTITPLGKDFSIFGNRWRDGLLYQLVVDNEGNLLDEFNYTLPNNSISRISRNQISADSTIHLSHNNQTNNGLINHCIIHPDLLGGTNFKVTHGNGNLLNEAPSRMSLSLSNNIISPGFQYTTIPFNLLEPWNTSYYILQVDAIGNIKHEINSQTETRGGSPSEVVHFINNEGEERLAFGSHELIVNESLNTIVNSIRYFIVDMEGNIQNSIVLSEPTSPFNYLSFNRKVTDGFLTCGQSEVGDVVGVWPVLSKMDEQGDTIWWSTYDINDRESLWDKVIVTGMDIMPSGSILICGNMTEFPDQISSNIRPFIMKLDKHGCLEPDCRPLVNAVSDELDEVEMSATPNPGSERVRISTSESGVLNVTDIAGRAIHNQSIHTGECTLNTTDWEKGVFVITLNTKNGQRSIKWIKL